MLRTFFLVVIAVAAFVPMGARAEPRKIGVLLPLTGPIAEYGVATQNAFQMAMDEAPADSLPRLFIEDNKYEAKEAVSALNKVLSIDQVDFIYNWGEDPSQAIAPIVEQRKVPMVAGSVNPTPAIGRKYVIRGISPADKFIVETFAYVRAHGLKKFAVVKTEDTYFDSLADRLKARLAADEQILAFHNLKPDDHDFRTIVTNLRPLRPELIFVYLNPGQASTFAIQARNLGVKAPFFGTDIFESQTEISDAHGTFEGAVFVSPETPDDFRASYVKRFGNDLQIAYAYNSYLTMKMILQALSRPWTTREQFIESLKLCELPNFKFTNSAEWGMYFDQPLALRRVSGGRLVAASARP